MHEVRFHGRGGQGAVTSAELLAQAAIDEGKAAQAFPSFGPERRGAPVMAFARVADEPILNRTVIQFPSAVIVLDPSLPALVDVAQGIQADGVVVLNSSKSPEQIRKETGIKVKLAVVDANHIAREEIGRVITNTTMLGALLAAVSLVAPERLEKQYEGRFGRLASKNINAFKRALKETVVLDAV
ncbi:MAG: 2-oxoacid:acceptor oxidoreductase family protein [Deltaproteobacteria bacterium]|nr:2-oxoacid:acceptor oxidoreductase family protein [Deltaproteobacteria bacterium]